MCFLAVGDGAGICLARGGEGDLSTGGLEDTQQEGLLNAATGLEDTRSIASLLTFGRLSGEPPILAIVHGLVFACGFVLPRPLLGLFLGFVFESVLVRDNLVVLVALGRAAVVEGCAEFDRSKLGARKAGGRSSSLVVALAGAVDGRKLSFSLLGLLIETNFSIAPFGILPLVAALFAAALALRNFFGLIKDSS